MPVTMLSKLVQKSFRMLGVNLTRLPGNRFDAMSDVLERLARQGFEPTLIIDAGANKGQWAATASTAYPHPPLHLIEPQTSCRPALEAFAKRRGQTAVHSVVVTRPGLQHIAMAGTDSTGAHVVRDTDGRSDLAWLSSTTIDDLLADRLRDTDRVLLKLDVEGHELDVLAGAVQTLSQVEVIVSEVSFFDAEHSGHTTFLEYLSALAGYGFALYDFAALGARRRDNRLRSGDVVFVRRGTPLIADDRWS